MSHPDDEQSTLSLPFHSHTALLLAAALPFLQPSYQYPAELTMKFLELSETVKLYREFSFPRDIPPSPQRKDEPGIFSFISRFIQDPEGLLRSLSLVCADKEKEFVTLLLNLIQAKNFYDNYGDILSTLMSADGIGNLFTTQASSMQESPTQEPPGPEDSTMPDMASVLAEGNISSMLSPEQNDTLNLLKTLLDAE